jgi:hypothetical protein
MRLETRDWEDKSKGRAKGQGKKGWGLELGTALSPQAPSLKLQVSMEGREAEGCFKAIKIAQLSRQVAGAAVMSLARLWQRQSKKQEAHRIAGSTAGSPKALTRRTCRAKSCWKLS